MYKDESLSSAYAGAGWAFPSETYLSTPPALVHFQGHEVLRRDLFPPLSHFDPGDIYRSHDVHEVLYDSLTPNIYIGDPIDWYNRFTRQLAPTPSQRYWNYNFDKYLRKSWRSANPVQHRLQQQIRKRSTLPEMREACLRRLYGDQDEGRPPRRAAAIAGEVRRCSCM